MQVFVFYSARGGWGFTPIEDGSNLPIDLEPWNKFKIINMHRGEPSRIAVNTDRCLDAIEQDGFYLSRKNPDEPGNSGEDD